MIMFMFKQGSNFNPITQRAGAHYTMKRYIIYIGDNNLHNVHRLVVVADSTTSQEHVIASVTGSFPKAPILEVEVEELINAAHLVAETFIGSWRKKGTQPS